MPRLWLGQKLRDMFKNSWSCRCGQHGKILVTEKTSDTGDSDKEIRYYTGGHVCVDSTSHSLAFPKGQKTKIKRKSQNLNPNTMIILLG